MSKQLKPMPEFSNAAEEQAFCGLSLKENAMTQKLLDPIPPGKILLEEFMKPMGVSINALSRDEGCKCAAQSHTMLAQGDLALACRFKCGESFFQFIKQITFHLIRPHYNPTSL
ncbi:MAG: hypothetical protein ABL862_04215 [Candidatus Nitrotoga sp.]